jgi:hypothetical protein
MPPWDWLEASTVRRLDPRESCSRVCIEGHLAITFIPNVAHSEPGTQ